MTDSFWIILIAVLIYGLVHSLLASLQVKARARHWFGKRADRWFRLLYNLIAVLTFLPVILLPVLLIDRHLYAIPFPWVILTTLIQLLALVALGIGVWQTGPAAFLGLAQLFNLPLRPSRLVENGLYRWVRHPLYTAGLVFIWLAPVMSWNLLALAIGATLYILIGITFEERKLQREFGEAYARYRESTPMLIPGLKIWRGTRR